MANLSPALAPLPAGIYYATALRQFADLAQMDPMLGYLGTGNAGIPTAYSSVPSVAYDMGTQSVPTLDQFFQDLVPEDVAPAVPAVPAFAAPAATAAPVATAAPAATLAKTAAPSRVHGADVWAGVVSPQSVHVTQVPSKYNPHPAAGNRDCGPASVVMALRMLGMKAPGASTGGEAQIDRVRVLATGSNSHTTATTNFELERALSAAGASTTEVASIEDVERAVLAGKPVVLNGNPRNAGAYGPRFSAKQMTPYSGGHWITVTGYDKRADRFIVNDPLSKVGAIKVTRKELSAYLGSSLGIVVGKAA
jgi:hypothetical protein